MPKPSCDLPHARIALAELAAAASAGELALFLDFDGTLAPIVDHPDDARISASLRDVVKALAAAMPVAIVSGRDLLDVQEKVGLGGVALAGSHGYCIQHADGQRESRGDDYLPDLDHAEHLLRVALEGRQGVWIERKRYAIAVHFRRAEAAALAGLEEEARGCIPGDHRLELHGGKMIYEVRPALDWHKGKAVICMLEHMPGRRPLFIGDDLTDEQAFAAIRGAGTGIVVDTTGRSTEATLRLDDVADVELFLGDLRARL